MSNNFNNPAIFVQGTSPVLVAETFTSNGDYSASDYQADGFSDVHVAVPAPTLITKNITANGDYAAQDETPPADGFSQVTVNVAGEEVFYAGRSGTPYPKKLVIPETYNSDNISSFRELRFKLYMADYLEEFEVLSPHATISGAFMNSGNIYTGAKRLHRVYLPYITVLNSSFASLPNIPNDYSTQGFLQIGSVGHPVTSISSNAFEVSSHSPTDESSLGWTFHIYTSATTLAEAATLLPYAPWGAKRATITYYNSTTGKEITQ